MFLFDIWSHSDPKIVSSHAKVEKNFAISLKSRKLKKLVIKFLDSLDTIVSQRLGLRFNPRSIKYEGDTTRPTLPHDYSWFADRTSFV